MALLEVHSLPKGLICPLVTPLCPDQSLDRISLARLMEHVGSAVEGIFLGDPRWGEGLMLAQKMRLDLLESALELCRGRWPLLVTITTHSLLDTRNLLAQMDALLERRAYPGAVFWVDYPLIYHSNRGLPQLYEELTAVTLRRFILGNLPQEVKRYKPPGRRTSIRTGVLKKISANQAVQGLIFSGSLKRALNYHLAVRQRKRFIFYDADEEVFLKSPGTGGVTAGGSNLLPHPWADVTLSSLNRYDVQRQYHRHQATIWQRGVMLNALLRLYQGAPAARLKIILQRTGLIHDAATVKPQSQPDNNWQKDLQAFLQAYDLV